MSEFINFANTDGSAAALDFCLGWARIVKEERVKQTALFAELRAEGVQLVVPDDGWANSQPGFLTIFFNEREHQYIDKLYFGAKVALISHGKGIRYLNLLEPAPSMFERVMSHKLIWPDSARFKVMPYDPNKEFWTVQRSITNRDEVEYHIRDKP